MKIICFFYVYHLEWPYFESEEDTETDGRLGREKEDFFLAFESVELNESRK